MAQVATKLPVKKEPTPPTISGGWQPFEALHREVDRLFDEFNGGFRRSPFRRSLFAPFARDEMLNPPAVDITAKDGSYEVTAELPGIDEKDIDVKLGGGMLTIKGQKKAEKQEKNKDYVLSERSYGAFERSFSVPEGVDAGKVAATFKNGVLTVTLPKTPVAQKLEKKIAVKAA